MLTEAYQVIFFQSMHAKARCRMTESFIEIESGHYITETFTQKLDVQDIYWERKDCKRKQLIEIDHLENEKSLRLFTALLQFI